MALQGHPRSFILTPIESEYAPFQRYCSLPESATPLVFHPNFRGVPFGLPNADVVAPMSEDPMLIIRVINFELVQPICSAYIDVMDGQTDGRTDDLR